MGSSAKPQKYNGARTAMSVGNAPAPGKPGGSSRGHVHDAGFSYADTAKSNPKVGGKGK